MGITVIGAVTPVGSLIAFQHIGLKLLSCVYQKISTATELP